MVSTKKILVIGPSWVGDMVLAHSLFQLLKVQDPNIQIDVAAPAWTLPLLERMPEVTEKIPLPFKHGQLALFERIKFGRSLKNRNYTQSISLVNSFKSAILAFAARIPRRTGYLGELRYGLLNDIRPLDKKLLPRTIDRFVALIADKNESLQPAPIPKLVTDSQHVLETLKQLNISKTEKPILGLCPGAEYGQAKRWPAKYYAEVARFALEKNWQVWLFGSDKDMAITSQINQLTENQCLDLGGKTKLDQAIDLMSLCDAIISNDSGLMHIAAALDKKLIAIFGSSDPFHTPPMHREAIIEYLGLECSPCFKRECPLKHLNCLNNISPQQIIKHFSAEHA